MHTVLLLHKYSHINTAYKASKVILVWLRNRSFQTRVEKRSLLDFVTIARRKFVFLKILHALLTNVGGISSMEVA